MLTALREGGEGEIDLKFSSDGTMNNSCDVPSLWKLHRFAHSFAGKAGGGV